MVILRPTLRISDRRARPISRPSTHTHPLLLAARHRVVPRVGMVGHAHAAEERIGQVPVGAWTPEQARALDR